MTTFEEEAQLRERQVPVAAEALFSRPLFKIPQFVVTTALGVGALVLDIRLDIAAWNETKPQCESSLWVAGVILVATWFAVTSHLEAVRARYLNESGFSGEQRAALSMALMSDFRMSLYGLTVLYFTVILLLLVIWHLLIG
jgi:hypothetical protein